MNGKRLGFLVLVALVIAAPMGRAQESASSGIVGQVMDFPFQVIKNLFVGFF